jgi:DNA-binding NarL/FixJ family response regulator
MGLKWLNLAAMALLKLLIVGDDRLARAGLALLLGSVPECVVWGQVNCADVAEELADSEQPDAIIWDMGWEIPLDWPDWVSFGLPIVALLSDGVEAAQLWAAGIRGLLTRDVNAEMLWVAAQTAVHGLIVLDPEFAIHLLPPVVGETALPTAVDTLTPREQEVLQLVAEGLTNKAIARQLHISDHTVKFHVNAVMTKLSAQSRTEAVVRATRLGLLLL